MGFLPDRPPVGLDYHPALPRKTAPKHSDTAQKPDWLAARKAGLGFRSLDPLFLKYWAKDGIDMSAFLTETGGQSGQLPRACQS
jgi:hypothetical protein